MLTFGHDASVWRRFPGLVPGLAFTERRAGVVDRPIDTAVLSQIVEACWARARQRLAAGTEAGFPEVQAWRRAFADLGLKPTQYRSAAEALLRRFRKDDALPGQHPLVDLGNAFSLAYAIPVAVVDVDRVEGDLTVRPATGLEDYLTFGGEHEHPRPEEIVFADDAGNAHSRRWTNRQSGLSAVSDQTRQVLIVAEALHERAGVDVPALIAELAAAVEAVWAPVHTRSVLSSARPFLKMSDSAG